MNVVTVIKSSIKGYHTFKIRPHDSIEMLVEREANNAYDPHAMCVKMPKIQEVHKEFRDCVTREARGEEAALTVRDIAGEMIGRVPANLCKVFRELLGNGQVKHIRSLAVNPPTRSAVPPPEQSFRRNPKGKDRRGGGAIIPCIYKLSCADGCYETVKKHVIDSLKELKGHQCTEEVQDYQNEDESKSSVQSCPW